MVEGAVVSWFSEKTLGMISFSHAFLTLFEFYCGFFLVFGLWIMNLEVPVLLIFSVGFFPQGPLWFLSNFSSFAIFLSTFATMFLWYADDKGRHFSSCISYSEELCSLGLWFSLFRVIIADYFPYTLGFGQTETKNHTTVWWKNAIRFCCWSPWIPKEWCCCHSWKLNSLEDCSNGILLELLAFHLSSTSVNPS